MMMHNFSSNNNVSIESPKRQTKPCHRRCPASPNVVDFLIKSHDYIDFEDALGPFSEELALFFPSAASFSDEDDTCEDVHKARSKLRLQPRARTRDVHSVERESECGRPRCMTDDGTTAFNPVTMGERTPSKKENPSRSLSKHKTMKARTKKLITSSEIPGAPMMP